MDRGALAYELVFQGLEQSEPKSLHRLRAALVGDLELSIEEARQVLDGTRFVIKRAKSEDELNHLCSLLKNAGARASIVRGTTNPPSPQAEFDDLSIAPEEKDSVETPHGASLDLVTPHAAAETGQESLDPLEQITDLFRDLEESCVTKSGAEVLKTLPKAATPKEVVVKTLPPPRVERPRKQEAPTIFEKRYWKRAVTAPEVVFSISFSLMLVAITALMYAP